MAHQAADEGAYTLLRSIALQCEDARAMSCQLALNHPHHPMNERRYGLVRFRKSFHVSCLRHECMSILELQGWNPVLTCATCARSSHGQYASASWTDLLHMCCHRPMAAVNELVLSHFLYHYHLRMRSSAGALHRAMYLLHIMGAYYMRPLDASYTQKHVPTVLISGHALLPGLKSPEGTRVVCLSIDHVSHARLGHPR